MAGGKGITLKKRRVVSTHPPPERVLLRRVYFLNKQHSKYISFGFYPNRDSLPHVEIGSSRQGPIVLTPYLFSTLALHLPKLCEHLCKDKPYKCTEMGFQLRTVGKLVKVKLYKNCIVLKSDEINYLLTNIIFLQNQLARYEICTPDVKDYTAEAMTLKTFVLPNNACPYMLYDVLFDELKSNLV